MKKINLLVLLVMMACLSQVMAAAADQSKSSADKTAAPKPLPGVSAVAAVPVAALAAAAPAGAAAAAASAPPPVVYPIDTDSSEQRFVTKSMFDKAFAPLPDTFIVEELTSALESKGKNAFLKYYTLIKGSNKQKPYILEHSQLIYIDKYNMGGRMNGRVRIFSGHDPNVIKQHDDSLKAFNLGWVPLPCFVGRMNYDLHVNLAEIEIPHIDVAEGFRKQGFAAIMVDFLDNFAAAHTRTVCIGTDARTNGSEALFRKCGFAEQAEPYSMSGHGCNYLKKIPRGNAAPPKDGSKANG